MPALMSSPRPVIFSPATTPTICQAASRPNPVFPATISGTIRRRPIGSSSGNSRRASVSLMSTTGGAPAVSWSLSVRPARRVIRRASKYRRADDLEEGTAAIDAVPRLASVDRVRHAEAPPFQRQGRGQSHLANARHRLDRGLDRSQIRVQFRRIAVARLIDRQTGRQHIRRIESWIDLEELEETRMNRPDATSNTNASAISATTSTARTRRTMSPTTCAVRRPSAR